MIVCLLAHAWYDASIPNPSLALHAATSRPMPLNCAVSRDQSQRMRESKKVTIHEEERGKERSSEKARASF
jgi:hypothetical protein